MTFEDHSIDDLECRVCLEPISLEAYRRWGLCSECEGRRELWLNIERAVRRVDEDAA